MGLLDGVQDTNLVTSTQDWLQSIGEGVQQGELGHIGAWGLPDYGITESFANEISPGSTDLGDALLGSTTTTDGGGGGGGGGGADNDPNNTTYTAPAGDNRLTELQKIGGNRNPVQETEYQNLLSSIQSGGDSDQAAIDNIYQPIIEALNQAQRTVEADKPSVLQEALDAFNLNKQLLDTSKQQGDQQLGESSIEAAKRNQTGTDNSRRLYNELVRGGVQRFGGSTSAGQGYKELLGVEQQRGSSQRQSDFSTAQREIETQKFNLAQEYDNTMLKLNQDHDAAKNEIRREFDAKIANINAQKASAESEKRNAKLGALQQMRAQINQINFSLAESRQLLDQQASQAAAKISFSEKQFTQFGEAGSTAAGSLGTDVSSGLSLGGAQTGGETSAQPTGFKSTGDRREDLFGLNPLIFGNNQ